MGDPTDMTRRCCHSGGGARMARVNAFSDSVASPLALQADVSVLFAVKCFGDCPT